MEKFASRLKKALDLRDMKQSELCDKTMIPKSAMSQYINGSFEPKQERLHSIAVALDVNEAWLMGYDNIPMDRKNNSLDDKIFNIQVRKSFEVSSGIENVISFDNFKQIPIIGTIACGEPILAEENHEGYTNIEINVHADFALRCKGDSMAPKFLDGDVVLIRQQPDVENGQIAAVLIDNEATLKRVYKNPDDILLSPENLSYRPMVYSGEEMNNIRILGLAIGYTRIF